MLKYILYTFALAAAASVLTGCDRAPENPGVEYASQMYHSIPLEPYSQTGYNEFFAKDKKNAREPVAGTIARDKMEYYFPFENTTEDYDRAYTLKSPIEATQANMDEGKRLYAVYCSHCHGKEGKGDGAVPAKPSYPGVPPAYTSDRVKNLGEGQIFFSIFHGKLTMGAHGSQIAPNDIWKIVLYVRKMRGETVIAGVTAPADAAPVTDSTATTADTAPMPAAQPATH